MPNFVTAVDDWDAAASRSRSSPHPTHPTITPVVTSAGAAQEPGRQPWTALVLSGGPGTRARAIDPDTPKPLLPIGGTPAVLRQARWLALCASDPPREIIVLTGHHAERVATALPSRIGATPVTAVWTPPQGTVAALRRGLALARSDRVLSLNGDTLVGCRLDRLLDAWPSPPYALTVACTESVSAPNRGEVIADRGQLLRMGRPSVPDGELRGLANTGVYLLSRGRVTRFLAHLPSGSTIERDLVNRVAALRLATVHNLGDVPVIDFGTPRGWRTLRAANPTHFQILHEVTP